MYLAFNELCIHKDITNINNTHEARQQMDRFVKLIYDIKTRGLLDGLICTHHIFDFNIYSEYGINDWLKDSQVAMKYKQFFRSIWDKNCSHIEASDFDSEFRTLIDSHEYIGTGSTYAVETESSTISMITNTYFRQNELYGIYVKIDDSLKLHETNEIINNVSAESNLDDIQSNIRKCYFDNISSGQDLWEQREKLFPNLIFCENVKDQLYKDPEKFHIVQILSKLQKIQEYFEHYDGQYNRKVLGLDARSESETVRTNNSLKNMRKFIKPNGEKEYFFEHIGFSGKFSAGRIHFLPDDSIRKCFIGYIGRHLPTKLY
jgi:hypothetical protein